MSIRESAQPPARSGELPRTAVSFTAKPVGPAVDTVSSVRKQPELIVNPLVLTFTQRKADKPVFSIVTIAQQHADTPITLSTDEPDYFQLASDSRPAFGPTLTLTPLPSGAFVHVRYMARKPGAHRAQLIIQAPFGSATVALEGRRAGALSVVQTVLPATTATNRAPTPEPHRSTSASRWAALLATMVVSGLVYGLYTYQCQLFPSLCREKTTGATRVESRSPLAGPGTTTISRSKESKKRSNRRRARAYKSPATRASSRQTSVSAAVGVADKSVNNQTNKSRRSYRNRRSSTVTDKEATGRKVRSRVRRRQDSTPASESELEQELNRQL